MITSQIILTQLRQALPDCDISIQGEGCNFTITAIGNCFAGKRTLQRQQMIHAVLGEYIASGVIHALTIKAYTADEHH